MGRIDGEPKSTRIVLPFRWKSINCLWHQVEAETISGRAKFDFPDCHLEKSDRFTRGMWMSVIQEEVGKLCRATNKLMIATDDQVREGYLDEGYHRIITSMSLLRRLAENWDKLREK